MVRAGERYEHKKVIVEIVEVLPYFDPIGRRMLSIAYRIIDGKRVSPVAHWWQSASEDPRKYVEQIVENYLTIIKNMGI